MLKLIFYMLGGIAALSVAMTLAYGLLSFLMLLPPYVAIVLVVAVMGSIAGLIIYNDVES